MVLSTARVPALPDVPTSSEVGLADLIYNAGLCLYAPAGTPSAAVLRVSDAVDTSKFIALVDRLRIEVFWLSALVREHNSRSYPYVAPSLK